MIWLCFLLMGTPELSTGASIHYKQSGSGPALVLIGGWGATHALFDPIRPLLEEHFTVIAPDNRGVGQSTDPGGAYNVTTMAEDVAALMEHLGHKRYHVLGISLGGFVAQELAHLHPEQVEKLILVATSLGGVDHLPPDQEVMQFFMSSASMPIEERIRKGLVLALDPDFAKKNQALIDQTVTQGVENPVDPGVLGKQTMAAFAFTFGEKAPNLTVQTLVLHGTNDRIVIPANGKTLADRLANATYSEIPNSGHLCLIDNKQKAAQKITEFLK